MRNKKNSDAIYISSELSWVLIAKRWDTLEESE